MDRLEIARILREAAENLSDIDKKRSVISDIKKEYGIRVDPDIDLDHLVSLRQSLLRLDPGLVEDCGITDLGFEDLGPSAKYYPNHGKYKDGKLILSTHLFEDPFLEVDIAEGSNLNKLDQIFYHELGHGWDERKSDTDLELSLHPDWLALSGWSDRPVKGHKRLIIKEHGYPELKGEFYYSPEARFVRYYGKRNPLDDWADTFAYYVARMFSFIPQEKKRYFDKKVGRHYG